MKKFTMKWLLLSIVLSIASIPQMNAGWNAWGNFYFDTSKQGWSNVTLVIGRSDCSKAFSFIHLDHTNLYYQWIYFDNYDDMYFIGELWDNDTDCNGQSPWTRVSGYSDRWQPYKGWYNENDNGNAKRYYFNGEYTSNIWYNVPYKTATVKVKKSVEGAAYTTITEGAWPAVINLKGTTISSYPTTTSQSNFDTESGDKAEYASIPISGEVTMTLGADKSSGDFVFEGWGTGSSPTDTETSKTYNIQENTTYYAFFRSPMYTVKFHANGGSGSMDDQKIYLNVSTALSTNSFTKTNYVFVGWATSQANANAGTVAYTDGQSVSSLGDEEGEVIDLYAVWEDQWCIKGSGTEMGSWGTHNGLSYVSGTTYSGSITLDATDYQFKVYDRVNNKWYSTGTNDGDVTITRASNSVSSLAENKGNLGLTADLADEEYIFTWNTTGNVLSVTFPTPTYDITYYDQGGSAFTGTQADPPTTHTYGTATDLVIPTREGYNFAGWFTESDCASGQVGNTSSATLSATGYTTDINLYAKWTDDGTYYYKGASANGWGTAGNWTKGAVPGSGSDIVALKPLQAPSGTTTVNSVRIATSGTYTPIGGDGIAASGSLTIPGGAALKVVTSVANCTISANAPTSGTSTTSSTLTIGYGGALAWGTAGTLGNATVGFYTPSGGVPGSEDAVNDYIGIPFTSLSSDDYYNAWVFAVSGDTWAEVSGATLSPWTGYNIIEKLEEGESAGASYSLTGTLVANNATVSSSAVAGTERLYANSWVAPIEISKMSITGTATVYLFRPTSVNDIEDAADPLGNYDTYPVNSSSGVYIPSMKSFSVVSSTVSVDYATAVYGEVANAFKAPRREKDVDYRQAIWDTQDSLFVTVKNASGWGDVLKMFIHEDFSQNYENGWDGPKMEGMWEAPKLYTLNNEGEMAVSCVPSVDNNVIAFHAGTASNEYTFTFKYSGEDELVLKDTKTGIETPIVDGGTYEFTSNKGDDDMRFVIKKAPAVVTGVDEISGNNSGVQKFMHNGTMYIVRDGRIYSVEGALVK